MKYCMVGNPYEMGSLKCLASIVQKLVYRSRNGLEKDMNSSIGTYFKIKFFIYFLFSKKLRSIKIFAFILIKSRSPINTKMSSVKKNWLLNRCSLKPNSRCAFLDGLPTIFVSWCEESMKEEG